MSYELTLAKGDFLGKKCDELTWTYEVFRLYVYWFDYSHVFLFLNFPIRGLLASSLEFSALEIHNCSHPVYYNPLTKEASRRNSSFIRCMGSGAVLLQYIVHLLPFKPNSSQMKILRNKITTP